MVVRSLSMRGGRRVTSLKRSRRAMSHLKFNHVAVILRSHSRFFLGSSPQAEDTNEGLVETKVTSAWDQYGLSSISVANRS